MGRQRMRRAGWLAVTLTSCHMPGGTLEWALRDRVMVPPRQRVKGYLEVLIFRREYGGQAGYLCQRLFLCTRRFQALNPADCDSFVTERPKARPLPLLTHSASKRPAQQRLGPWLRRCIRRQGYVTAAIDDIDTLIYTVLPMML